ncbi:MAG: cytochrome c4 [Burkholderiales bacterium]|nr:cytochrome c4 [Burkholderiales bacterium]
MAIAFAAPVAIAADAPEVVQTVCSACHGVDGNSVAPTFPKLAGLQAAYLEKQMREFLSGKRKNEIMDASLPALKSADLTVVAAYYAEQKPAGGTVSDEKLAAAGKVLFDDGNTTSGVPACSGCHLPTGAGNERYPRLAGQHATYTAAQIQAFKAGTRTNDKARVMRAVAARLTDEEIAAVAEYIAGL